MKNNTVLLEVKDIVKKFGEVTALNQVSLEIRGGEIHGLIGENGSGKSTVSSVICGIHQATSGELYLKGKLYNPKSPLDARENHISMIVQETDTIDLLSIAENVFLGQEQSFGKAGFVNLGLMQKEAREALKRVGLDTVDVTAPIASLNFETRKIVEIAKALYYQPELLIIDETTTALSQDGREKIYEIMKKMKEEGRAVLFISHDLPELVATCDCLTVLRDGKLIETIKKEQFDESYIKKSMVGRTLAEQLYRTDYETTPPKPAVVQVKEVSADMLREVSLDLHEGEILGLGGLSGSGMHEMGQVLAGLKKVRKGNVVVFGERLKDNYHAAKLKVGYISKNRDAETLILSESIQDNLTISAWDMLRRFKLFILPGEEKKFALEQIKLLNIKSSSRKQTVRELSGGNKQKVSFGKLIGNKSKVLILDSPTRGVDIGVKTTMYQLIYDLKQQGFAIVIISEELPELIGMSDRILIFKDGRIRAEFMRSETLSDTDIIDFMI
ncbi:sugar ABC transporter ATP-binding protein [Anaerocolumna sp. AGMB13025]|uniref:sugar ABC transporter ATP-binding protein n=1 Tax=Anaerocolumna sp. AGMB13025 TaxID=3039116 RepID=UPI0024204E4D|nr:sugar ABC transporter ATP-binding protein [Anaerocolumna sp. AGMB13025]WFR56700.1 sugar ABC transporter ATP-binding protein [Anaerocolumna sp. AGMB13025]